MNITIRDTVVLDAHGGLNVQTRGPGSVRNLTVANLVVSHAIFDAPCKPWMGNAQPVAISADRWCGGPAPCDENGGPPAGTITVRCLALARCRHLAMYFCLRAVSPYSLMIYTVDTTVEAECRVGKHNQPVRERYIHFRQSEQSLHFRLLHTVSPSLVDIATVDISWKSQ